MGMDLKPIEPSDDAPVDVEGRIVWGRYNWSGWSRLIDLLEQWGVRTNEFSGTNDGDLISEPTCLKVADAIESHLPTLSEEEQRWLRPHIQRWRTCGGYQQY